MEGRPSHKPLKEETERHCTNVEWFILFCVHGIVFLVVVFAHAGNGHPGKLFAVRDFRGDFCGYSTEFNRFATRDYSDHRSAVKMMNVSGTLQAMAHDVICSTFAHQELRGLLAADELAQYECGCCLSPCDGCSSALSLTVFSTLDALVADVQDRVLDLTDASRASLLHSGSGANQNAFVKLFQVSITDQFLTQTCASSCGVWDTVGDRPYTYEPLPDMPWASAWRQLRANGSQRFVDAMTVYMRLNALPESQCPYDPEYCVLFPGVVFREVPGTGFCWPYIPKDIVDSRVVSKFVGETAWSLGEAFGTVVGALDVFVINATIAFVVGILFIILVRLFVFWVVWCSFFLVFVIIMIPGVFAFVQAEACAGSTTTGQIQRYADSAVVVASSATGLQSATGNEAITGNGIDYRGAQTRTIGGLQCQEWVAQAPHVHSFTPSNYPSAGLDSNYCRNPGGVATSIWCYTVDAGMAWDLCIPLDAFSRGRCPDGPLYPELWQRTLLRLVGGFLMLLALMWLCSVWWLRSRISLAIDVFKQAGEFIVQNPTIVAVPGLQVFFAVVWFLVWGVCVGFMLSQVPADYNSAGYFHTYSEAHSECIEKPAAGWVWRDHGDISSADNPCSGNYGNILGIDTACWRCALPRNIFDARVFWALFSFYWVGELICAIEQFVISAGCVNWALRLDGQGSALVVGFWWVFRYHFGSLAFGSCILAVVKTARDIALYFRHKAKVESNKVMECICGCLACCLDCFERFLEYLSEKAYIQIAIEGEPFCQAALETFKLIASNFVRYGVLDIIGAVIFRIGVTTIAAVSTLCSYLVLTGMYEVTRVFMPMFFYFALSVVVAEVYMNVYRTAADTMLQVTILAEAGKLPPGSNPRGCLESYLKSANDGHLAQEVTGKE